MCGWMRQGSARVYLCHVAIVVQGSQVVQQLQSPHESFWRRRVHEVEVHLKATNYQAG